MSTRIENKVYPLGFIVLGQRKEVLSTRSFTGGPRFRSQTYILISGRARPNTYQCLHQHREFLKHRPFSSSFELLYLLQESSHYRDVA